MKKVYTALLLILLAAMFSVGVYSLADYDATGSVSEKREFVKPEFSVKSLLDGTYIPALEQYYSDTFPGRESLLKANRTLNKFYYYSGSGEDSVLILNQSDSAAQGGESLDAVQRGDTVIIRAYGVPREDEARLLDLGAHVLDATCPKVKQAQLAIDEATRQGTSLYLFIRKCRGSSPMPTAHASCLGA